MRAMRVSIHQGIGVTTTFFLKARRDFETVADMVFIAER
jgi:hypothetical protein